MGTLGRGRSPCNGLGRFDHRDKTGRHVSTWSIVENTKASEACMYVCMVTHIAEYGSPGKGANPVRGQLNRENEYFPVRVRA